MLGQTPSTPNFPLPPEPMGTTVLPIMVAVANPPASTSRPPRVFPQPTSSPETPLVQFTLPVPEVSVPTQPGQFTVFDWSINPDELPSNAIVGYRGDTYVVRNIQNRMPVETHAGAASQMLYEASQRIRPGVAPDQIVLEFITNEELLDAARFRHHPMSTRLGRMVERLARRFGSRVVRWEFSADYRDCTIFLERRAVVPAVTPPPPPVSQSGRPSGSPAPQQSVGVAAPSEGPPTAPAPAPASRPPVSSPSTPVPSTPGPASASPTPSEPPPTNIVPPPPPSAPSVAPPAAPGSSANLPPTNVVPAGAPPASSTGPPATAIVAPPDGGAPPASPIRPASSSAGGSSVPLDELPGLGGFRPSTPDQAMIAVRNLNDTVPELLRQINERLTGEERLGYIRMLRRFTVAMDLRWHIRSGHTQLIFDNLSEAVKAGLNLRGMSDVYEASGTPRPGMRSTDFRNTMTDQERAWLRNIGEGNRPPAMQGRPGDPDVVQFGGTRRVVGRFAIRVGDQFGLIIELDNGSLVGGRVVTSVPSNYTLVELPEGASPNVNATASTGVPPPCPPGMTPSQVSRWCAITQSQRFQTWVGGGLKALGVIGLIHTVYTISSEVYRSSTEAPDERYGREAANYGISPTAWSKIRRRHNQSGLTINAFIREMEQAFAAWNPATNPVRPASIQWYVDLNLTTAEWNSILNYLMNDRRAYSVNSAHAQSILRQLAELGSQSEQREREANAVMIRMLQQALRSANREQVLRNITNLGDSMRDWIVARPALHNQLITLFDQEPELQFMFLLWTRTAFGQFLLPPVRPLDEVEGRGRFGFASGNAPDEVLNQLMLRPGFALYYNTLYPNDLSRYLYMPMVPGQWQRRGAGYPYTTPYRWVWQITGSGQSFPAAMQQQYARLVERLNQNLLGLTINPTLRRPEDNPNPAQPPNFERFWRDYNSNYQQRLDLFYLRMLNSIRPIEHIPIPRDQSRLRRLNTIQQTEYIPVPQPESTDCGCDCTEPTDLSQYTFCDFDDQEDKAAFTGEDEPDESGSTPSEQLVDAFLSFTDAVNQYLWNPDYAPPVTRSPVKISVTQYGTSAAVAGATVTATSSSDTMTGTTDSLGFCTFQLIVGYNYTLQATSNTYTANGTTNVPNASTVVLALNPTSTTRFTETITVRNASNVLASGCSVTVTCTNGTDNLSGTTNSSGVVTFNMLYQKSYNVHASQSGQSGDLAINNVIANGSYNLTMTIPRYNQTITVMYNGSVAVGSSVTATCTTMTDNASATTNSAGQCVLSLLSGQSYSVNATSGSNQGSITINVSSAASYTITMTTPTPGRINIPFHVVHNMTPQVGANVTGHSTSLDETDQVAGRTDSNGDCILSVFQGADYIVTAVNGAMTGTVSFTAQSTATILININ